MPRPLASGPHVSLHAPSEGDASEYLDAVAASRELQEGWVSPPTSPAAFAAYLERLREPAHAGFFLRTEGRLVGVVNINNIVKGAFRSGHLGYYAFTGGEGRGHMAEGLRLVIDRAFGELGLHRLEANIQPGNVRSIALVHRLGFTKEGFSPRYLFIAGEWRDHERWAITEEDWVVTPSRVETLSSVVRQD
ncbi:GNAT family N-acetyltransferase [Nannocystis punicea]|uniref:GNAT family protein n=1 Tax=Nannocystis punicea TaxID=2995304 RepID=A0ABY7HAS2_9BACT|nr:GNAT family protein [Nannocystis poenicansa]WAS96215.1 GNAT family protein [Nannocystis poenicansa]